jgi:cytochrome c-type biogenesis protein CcsB
MLSETDAVGKTYIALVASFGQGRQNLYLEYGKVQQVGSTTINFSEDFIPGQVNIKLDGENLLINTPDTLSTMAMMGGTSESLNPNEWHPFEQRKLYQFSNISLVLTNIYKNATTTYASSRNKNQSFPDALIIKASSGDESKEIALKGGKGYEGEVTQFTLNGVDIQMTYGSKRIDLPFKLQLVDFQLERYPGSMSPSSYASEVILIDDRDNVNKPYRIYMNHILNYGGYRFFQSSYDKDELGTVLSVNHDYWGTFFTYIGYLLMAIGMFLTPFNKYSRFALLGRLLKKNAAKAAATAVALFLVFGSSLVYGQHSHTHSISNDEIPPVNKVQAEKFGKLLVQSHDGRLKPINTFSSEILRKVSRKNSFNGMNSDQVLLGMLSQPNVWQKVKMIKVSDKELKQVIGIDGKYASYLDFIDVTSGTYKLSQYVSAAYEKKPAARNMFDKEIMKVDERLNICYMTYTGELLEIFPNPTDSHESWYSPADKITGNNPDDSTFIKTVFSAYLSAVANGDLQTANQLVEGIDQFQRKYGADIMPSDSKRHTEIVYNKINIFNNLSEVYGILGFIMLILGFIEIFRKSKALRITVTIVAALILLGFVAQTAGLAVRWYISGHAPWSNGYESLVYISWVIMLSGVIFSRKSYLTLAATTVLTSIVLMVAHLSWMDPEITNLVPVLKSYWLTIHVSIITASYGFLALGMLLGFLNLVIMIFKNKSNFKNLDLKINDLTAINERTLMIGLYMLTIGTFLGGVWANESWGRYWGWDPKETWALVSVLVYSFILHMHYIPGLKNKFSFNFASLIGYFSILMTYFGVNYYLSGLHSYAAGDPVPIPTFVYYTVATIFAVSLWAYLNNRRFTKAESE